MTVMQAARQLKPGLGLFLDVELAPELIGTATAAVAAALALPGLACVASLAEKPAKAPLVSSSFPITPATQDAPRSFWSLISPSCLGLIFAKNVGLHLLIKFNLYMIEQNDYEYKKAVADEQGTLPPQPPQMMKVDDAISTGIYFGFRELASNTIRTIYEYLAYWKLGPTRSQPFLRSGPMWVVSVLHPRHTNNGSSAAKKAFSYTMALLHAQALTYAAECTVAVGIYVASVVRDKTRPAKSKAHQVFKCVGYHVVRCTILLAATSAVGAVGTLIKPGFGTRAGLLLTDQAVNVIVHPVARGLRL